jgi:hypothetical protein
VKTARLVVVVVLGACDGSGGVAPDSVPVSEHALSIDVIARSSHITAYLNGSDYLDTSLLVDDEFRFPPLGECIPTTDGIAWQDSCVRRIAVVSGGQRHEVDVDRYYALDYETPDPLPADFALEIEGCGAEPVHIPITTVGTARPVLDIQPLGTGYHASWTSDQAYESALVNWGVGLGGTLCHQSGNTSALNEPNASFAFVTLLQGPAVTTGSWGVARVWGGGSAYKQLP